MNTKSGIPSLVIGASLKPGKYSNMAVQLLKAYGHSVRAIGNKEGETGGVHVSRWSEHDTMSDIHTVTIYLNPSNQLMYYNFILALKPQRVIFNPGTENPELQNKLTEAGIDWEEACTLVILRSGQY